MMKIEEKGDRKPGKSGITPTCPGGAHTNHTARSVIKGEAAVQSVFL